MIPLYLTASLVVAALGGIFFAFSTFIMRGLKDAAPASGMMAMQEINKRVYGSEFLAVFFGFALISAILGAWALATSQFWVAAGAVVYLLGVFAMTIFVHVPMNHRLDRGDAALDYWPNYHDRWTRLNHIRSFSCFASAAAYLTGALAIAA